MNRFFLILILLLPITNGFTQSIQLPDSLLKVEAEEPYIVGIKPSPPFIIENENGGYSGLSIYLWKRIATKLNLNYKFKSYNDLGELLKGVERREVDLSINPLTVTPERLVQFDFTQPFFITNLSIAVPKKESGPIMRFLSNLISWEFFTAIGLLILVILLFGLLAWFFERRHNKEEFENNARGVWDSFWWSAVTMTTVGYGDKAPKSTGGRIIALIWMFTAIVIISGFTASIASSLTVDQLSLDINSLEDLKGKRVITVEASTSDNYLKINKIDAETTPTLEEALKLLEAGEVEALVYDEPLLRYKISEKNLGQEIAIAPSRFFTQYYAYALPHESKELQALNLALIHEIETLEWKAELGEYQLE